jgi:hypothetical protein
MECIKLNSVVATELQFCKFEENKKMITRAIIDFKVTMVSFYSSDRFDCVTPDETFEISPNSF